MSEALFRQLNQLPSGRRVPPWIGAVVALGQATIDSLRAGYEQRARRRKQAAALGIVAMSNHSDNQELG